MINRILARVRRSDRGAAVVEMAFVMPMLVLFLIASLQVGLVVIGSSTASNAAREGARAASIRYECADNHVSARCTANPSTNYTFIKNAVLAKLAGLVKTSTVTVAVECRADSSTGAVVLCEKGHVSEGGDVVIVTVGWQHVGATPFVLANNHTTVARSVIIGRPDLTVLAPEPDTTPASLLTAIAYDTNADGVLDQIKLTFSEDIVNSVSASTFTITNSVTGSNAIASATVSNRVATLTLSGNTVNTAPGAMRIALAAASNGIVDLWGNQSSFTATALTDAAAPVLTSLSDSNVALGTAGFPNTGDTLTLGFSESIGTALTATTITYTAGNPDTISISGVSAGPQNVNGDYIKNNKTAVATGTVLITGSTVLVTVVAVTSGLLDLNAVSGEAAWIFVPATSLVDGAGNAATVLLPLANTRTISNLF